MGYLPFSFFQLNLISVPMVKKMMLHWISQANEKPKKKMMKSQTFFFFLERKKISRGYNESFIDRCVFQKLNKYKK